MRSGIGSMLQNKHSNSILSKKGLRVILLIGLVTHSLQALSQKDYAALVNPFIGTGGHGHTYPGATLPFGMMQLSPDTRLGGWDGASGYHYSDTLMYGFSHTHLSGTGAVDYGDVLLMPYIGETKWQHHEYASTFSHQNEKASPGYYQVLLDKGGIHAQLTTTLRAGMHQYTFPKGSKEGAVLIDLQHRDEVLESYIEKVSDTELKGYRRSSAWAKDQRLYFHIQFEQPIASYAFLEDQQQDINANRSRGKNVKMAVRFRLDQTKALKVKVGISAVDEAGARKNLQAEMLHWDFDRYVESARAVWNKELSKIEAEGGSRDERAVFYTALYHSLISPNVYQDVDGRYRSTDLQVHEAKDFTNHTVFSLWDTYRTFHPLHTIINQKRTSDWINTFLAQYQYGGMLPVWELSGNETFTMIGYHSVPVIWDAYQKGISGFDAHKALEAAVSYAESNRFGLPVYRAQGYVSNEAEPESVSKTMEYAYDDWCIAQLAKAVGNQEVYQKYITRAQYYKNLFDVQTSHIRGKRQAIWHHPFDPREINTFHTEGNAWQYAFAAPQDIQGLIKLFGGEEAFLENLNKLFTTSSKTTGFAMADVSGFIGQYAHGNEPSHHMAYLFNYAGQPWRTQELVHRIRNEFYHNAPDGLIGNEDCGQMSAWYVMSALGFYPVCPGDGTYVLGTPLFDKLTVHLENGKRFVIKANKQTAASFYIQSASWNNKPYTKSWISHQDLMKGGILQLRLGDKPKESFGAGKADRPATAIPDYSFVPVPYVNGSSYRFRQKREVALHTIDPSAAIYYAITNSSSQTLDSAAFRQYTKPFRITETSVVQAFAKKDGARSQLVKQGFLKLPADKTITILSKIHPMYTAGEPEALIDGVLGTSNWRTGEWQAYPAQDFEAVIDLQQVRPVSYAGVHVLQFLGPSIIYPRELVIEGSLDGKTFFPLARKSNTIPMEEKELQFQELGTALKAEARYLKIKALNGGKLPAWHSNPGGPSRIFISEVIVR